MTEDLDPYHPPATRATVAAEPLTLTAALSLLVKILFVLSVMGGTVLGVTASRGATGLLQGLLFGLVYGIAAVGIGFLPLLLGASLYLRLHELGHANVGMVLLAAFAAVVLPVGVVTLLFQADMRVFAGGVLFCYLHAAPTALIGHRLAAREFAAAAVPVTATDSPSDSAPTPPE